MRFTVQRRLALYMTTKCSCLIPLQLPCDSMWQLQLAGCSCAPGGTTDTENRATHDHQPARSTRTTAPAEENPVLGLTKPILWLNSESIFTPLTQQACLCRTHSDNCAACLEKLPQAKCSHHSQQLWMRC